MASSNRALPNTTPPGTKSSDVTGRIMIAATNPAQARLRDRRSLTGTSAASTSQNWWCVHDTGENTRLAAPTMAAATRGWSLRHNRCVRLRMSSA